MLKTVLIEQAFKALVFTALVLIPRVCMKISYGPFAQKYLGPTQTC